MGANLTDPESMQQSVLKSGAVISPPMQDDIPRSDPATEPPERVEYGPIHRGLWLRFLYARNGALRHRGGAAAVLVLAVFYFLSVQADDFSAAALGAVAVAYGWLTGALALWMLFFLILRPLMQARRTPGEVGCIGWDAHRLWFEEGRGGLQQWPWERIERAYWGRYWVALQGPAGDEFWFPRSALPATPMEALQRRLQGLGVLVGPSLDGPKRSGLSKLAGNLRQGRDLLLLRRPDLNATSATGMQLLLLALLSLLLQWGLDYAMVAGAAEFNPWALHDRLGNLLLLLAAGLLALHLAGRSNLALPVLTLLLAVKCYAVLIQGGMDWLYWQLEHEQIALLLYVLGFAWILLAWLRLIQGALKGREAFVGQSLIVLFAVAVLPQWLIPADDLWYAVAPRQPEAPQINVEEVYYSQPAMLEQALAQVAPQRPGVTDLYHLGFAGFAGQDVFRREVGHVRELMDRRFDTAGRSLLLINHRATLEQYPIASASNLRMALRGLAERMDPDEDILFVYLTSHGGEDQELAVDFWPLRLNTFNGEVLREALDAAGIRWRVVAVSACYSGGFAEALKGPNTLVMTAAAADRQSFGCSNENAYTYFGEALFDRALRRTYSFVEAFRLADAAIRQREAAEGLEPSAPVMAAGAPIVQRLQRLEARLRRDALRADGSLPAPAFPPGGSAAAR